jgi:hypothetical protein
MKQCPSCEANSRSAVQEIFAFIEPEYSVMLTKCLSYFVTQVKLMQSILREFIFLRSI